VLVWGRLLWCMHNDTYFCIMNIELLITITYSRLVGIFVGYKYSATLYSPGYIWGNTVFITHVAIAMGYEYSLL